MKEGAVIIEVGKVRYMVSNRYQYLSREWKDRCGRPYWSEAIPEDEEEALWSEIVRRLSKEEEQ